MRDPVGAFLAEHVLESIIYNYYRKEEYFLLRALTGSRTNFRDKPEFLSNTVDENFAG